MRPLRIAGATRVVAEDQDEFQAIAILDTGVEVEGHGVVNAMHTAWELEPAELEALKAGAPVILRILGTIPPPVNLFVGQPPIVEDASAKGRATGDFPCSRHPTLVHCHNCGDEQRIGWTPCAFDEIINALKDVRCRTCGNGSLMRLGPRCAGVVELYPEKDRAGMK